MGPRLARWTLFGILLACRSNTNEADSDSPSLAAPSPSLETTSRETASQTARSSPTELRIDGTWVFIAPTPTPTPTPGASGIKIIELDARHVGTPTIQSGCLLVGDAIVVWPANQSDAATRAVKAAKSAQAEPIVLGGGGVSIREDGRGQLPPSIIERCGPRDVWYASPPR